MGQAAHLSFRRLNALEEQKDYDRAAGQEGAERNRALSSRGPLAEEHDCGDESGGERAEEECGDDVGAEQRADQEAQLHVSHPEGRGIRESDDKEEEARSEAGHQPFHPVMRIQREVGGQDRQPRGHDDSVRDDVALQIVTRDHDEHDERRDDDKRFPLHPVSDDAQEREKGGEPQRRHAHAVHSPALVGRGRRHEVASRHSRGASPSASGAGRVRAAVSIALTRSSIGIHLSTAATPFQRASWPSSARTNTVGTVERAWRAATLRLVLTRESPISSNTTSARWRSTAATVSRGLACAMSYPRRASRKDMTRMKRRSFPASRTRRG